MPWVYHLILTKYRGAKEIQTDWEENIPGNAAVQNDYGGVSVVGRRCIIVSERNNPDFEEMENLDYVVSIDEHTEIPSGVEQADLGLGFSLDRR